MFHSSRKQLEAAQAELDGAKDELRLAAAVFDSVQAVMVTDPHGVIQRVNSAFSELTGYSGEEVVGKTPKLLQSGYHHDAFYKAMRRQIKKTGKWQGEIWDRHKSGRIFPKWLTITVVCNEAGELTHQLATYVDLSEQKQAEERIHQLTFYDVLTQLPNRALLLERLQRAMEVAAKQRHQGALLYIDLDDFKRINDSLGYRLGDQLLKQTSQRLQSLIAKHDTVARVGANAFAVIVNDACRCGQGAPCRMGHIGEQYANALRLPYALDDTQQICFASLGLVAFTAREQSADRLLKQAELAMHQAKQQGGDQIRFFDPKLEQAALSRLQSERALNVALEQHQLMLYYQPQITPDVRVYGAEVLVRWDHPEKGIVGPDQFIPLAEQTGQILPLGRWVLQAACEQLSRWQASALSQQWVMAVNVSAYQLRQADFIAQVAHLLKTHAISPANLKLELTESVLVDNPKAAVIKMRALKALGVRLSLDDFGTGYSSLSYLQQMPVDQIKIDQSFVGQLLDHPKAKAIVRASIAMAKALGLEVVAEGVETAAQRDALAELGCDVFQGYYYARPMPLEALKQWHLDQD